jgi:hypothetical protein
MGLVITRIGKHPELSDFLKKTKTVGKCLTSQKIIFKNLLLEES